MSRRARIALAAILIECLVFVVQGRVCTMCCVNGVCTVQGRGCS